MKHPLILSPEPDRRETVPGFSYLVFQLALLPTLLTSGNLLLGRPLNLVQLNFVFYLLNFLAVFLIFRRFLNASWIAFRQQPRLSARTAVLGLAVYWLCFLLLGALGKHLLPGFANRNDNAIFAMGQENFFLMALGTAVLVPPAEECLYRGLIFRKLYAESPAKAYWISSLAFASIHILGYLGQYSLPELCFALVQYLPAGLVLAWSYAASGTIFVPIWIHAAVNLITILTAR